MLTFEFVGDSRVYCQTMADQTFTWDNICSSSMCTSSTNMLLPVVTDILDLCLLSALF